jgi:tetratricopeptide (TPR) repeat protein
MTAVLGRRWLAPLALVGLVATLSAQPDTYAEDLRKADESLLKGRLARARGLFEDILAASEEEPEGERPDAATIRRCRLGLLELAFRQGDYTQVESNISKLPQADRATPAAQRLLARLHLRRGRYEKAIGVLEGLVERVPSDYESRYLWGATLAELGRREAADKVFTDTIDLANKSSVRDALGLCYVARCYLALGGRENVQMASALLVESIRIGPTLPEARTVHGILQFTVYSEREGFGTAESYLKKVLENNGDYEDALLGLYRSRRANMWLSATRTFSYLERCLALNPNSVPALVEQAREMIDDRRFEEADRILDKALAINPRDKRALAHKAATAFLMNRAEEYGALRKRALATDPHYADLDRILGDCLVALYRFEDAIPHYVAALKVDADSVPAMHGLAKAYIYTGNGQAAVELLSRAKKLQAGYANPWRHNVLAVEDLLKQDYEVVEKEHFVFLLHKEDRAVLEDYLARWHEEAREVLGKKYGYLPPQKVRVEVFHRWLDFSVRTIGFRGFSALGACFGPFVTLVSPCDDQLRRQDFMWTATVWHEYAHVLTLALSKHRVPRWLTEGLSVYEESAKNPSWERGMVRELLDAYHNNDIVPVRLLNRVFRTGRILFGYYQGGLIVEYLAEHHGFDKVVSMLKAYGEDKSTTAIFQDTFGLTTREFDARLREWIKTTKIQNLRMVPRYDDKSISHFVARLVADPDDLQTRINLAWAYLQRNNPIDAGRHLAKVLQQDPKNAVGQLLRAELAMLRKRDDEAMAAYRAGFDAGADDFMARLHFAGLLEKAGKLDEALKQYQFAKRCWPRCTDQELSPQLRLARVLRRQGRETEAMMEMKAFCNLTARAFKPRLELAKFEREHGNRESEVRFLQEAIQIDPFMREVHERLGDALVAVKRPEEAVTEYQVGLAVPTRLDRAHLGKPAAQVPDPQAPEEATARARLALKAAKVCWQLSRKQAATKFLDRVVAEAPDSDLADEARELRAKWNL